MKPFMFYCGLFAVATAIGCEDEYSSTSLERTLGRAVQAEIDFPFGRPGALLRTDEGSSLNLAVIAGELGIRLESYPEDFPGCNLSPPVPAYLTIGDSVRQIDQSVIVPVDYFSFGPPEGENATAIGWEVTLREANGDWHYERVIEVWHQ